MAELASQPTSVQSAYASYRDDKLYVNRRYQRKLVWTLEEKQKLIELILKRYPVPAILLAEREDSPGTYEIIDGLQRLHAIVSFIETSFPTLDGKLFELQYFPTAKSRADEGLFTPNVADKYLSQREVSTILDYNLALSVMRGATESEVNDVFDRINTYGHRLSDQERRQAGVENDFSNTVRKIACTLRGDASADVLPLKLMPSISIDLPITKHGYQVQANEVFWVNQGILRATDLRDSMDEQCIADIAACIVSGELLERSRAVQRSIVSPFSNGVEEFEAQRRTKDSLGRKSLNLCEATESFGGCLEVIRTFPLAARNNPRSAARRRQTLPTAACPAVFHFRDCERCQLVSRHPHLHQGPSATAEQSL